MLLLLPWWASCSSDPVATTGDLVGVVGDARTGATLAGVSVSLTPTGKTVSTGSNGVYEFRDLPGEQEYKVDAAKSGYKSDQKSVYVSIGRVANLDFQLTPSTGELSVSRLSVDFGPATTSQTFNIENKGAAPLSWTLSEDAAWLSCNPASGTTQAGEQSSVVVSVDRTGLERGNYSQTIAVASSGGSAVVTVTMSVQGIAVSVSPEALDFGSTTTAMPLTLTNTGSGNISYTLAASNSWIKLSRTSGTFSQTETVTVSVDRTALAEGDHSGSLTLAVGENKLDIPVRMNIPSKEKPTVSLQLVDKVGYSSAAFKGAVVSVGSAGVTRYGFCWDTAEQPTVGSPGSCNMGDTQVAKDFEYTAGGLTPSTTYYVRAYAENKEGLSYSNQLKFQTAGTPQVPTVETGTVSAVQSAQAQASGNLTQLGNVAQVTQYGHVWSLAANPTLADSRTELGTTAQTGAFSSTLTGLAPYTTYHVRAYATNSVGTAYGSDVAFTTAYADVTLTTGAVNDITHKSATVQATITSTGGHTISERGVCWSTAPAPTLSGHSAASPATTATFSVPLTGLSERTVYYVRAYARTDDGQVFYGDEKAFSTTAKNVKLSHTDFESESDWTR